MTAQGLAVKVEEIWRSYGPVHAVAGVSLHVQPGEFVSLLGPSGCGKTTLLMMLAGFDQPHAGRILVGDADVTRVPANKRNIAMVFQRYALFPHMTVAENILFPLKMRRVGRSERDQRVRAALDMVKLADFADRKPAELSGGQQQRVALARAIVFDPPVILMDEPLGALDKKLRQHMQIELKELQQRLGATVIYVTHDQEEALTMSDRVAVMRKGQLMQQGSPRDLYDRPANAFVADFIGETSFVPGRLRGREGAFCAVETAAGTVLASPPDTPPTDGAVMIALRPEHLTLTAAQSDNGLAGKVAQVVFNGATIAVHVDLSGGGQVRADAPALSGAADLRPGAPVTVGWAPERALVFAAAPA